MQLMVDEEEKREVGRRNLVKDTSSQKIKP
jgi:hypothetical protein